MKVKLAIVLAIYLLGFSVTYGFAFNECYYRSEDDKNYALLEGMFCGAIWPLYWPCYLSVMAFEKT